MRWWRMACVALVIVLGWLLAIPDERAIYAVARTGRPSACTFTVHDDPTP